MQARPRGFPLFRAALGSALVGYWVANAVADPREYAAIGLRYEGSALHPILAQTLIALVLLGLTSIPAFRRTRPTTPSAWLDRGPVAVFGLLTLVQVGLFGLMETVERLWLGSGYADAFHGGPFDLGFLIEVLIAIVSAVVVVAVMTAMVRAVRAILAGPRPLPAPGEPATAHVHPAPFVRPVPVLVGAGGVRAPPAA